jgi:hypothetical protein
MTTISEIISDAYRESNLISINATPTVAQQTEALRLLNRIVIALFGNEAGDPFTNINVGNNNVQTTSIFVSDNNESYFNSGWTVPQNSRLTLNLTEPRSLILNPCPNDGERLSVVDASNNLSANPLTLLGNGRSIEGATSLVVSVDGTETQWFYRSDTANWAKLSSLLITDESPFPSEFDDLLIIGLTIRLSTRNGGTLAEASVSNYNNVEREFKARYAQPTQIGSEIGLVRTASNRAFWPKSNRNAFNYGIY